MTNEEISETLETFDPAEEQIETKRAFLSKPIEEMSLDELYTELEGLREGRASKAKKAKTRARKEKEAKWVVEMLRMLPPKYKEIIQQLPAEKKRALLNEVVKKAKARKLAKEVKNV
ncbi:hypothetical protein MYX65_00670 [Acidobacteria bacterium AH-259-L09]|nr:hypothetical protein [Acidobacteria bacterium AH-259-L09]